MLRWVSVEGSTCISTKKLDHAPKYHWLHPFCNCYYNSFFFLFFPFVFFLFAQKASDCNCRQLLRPFWNSPVLCGYQRINSQPKSLLLTPDSNTSYLFTDNSHYSNYGFRQKNNLVKIYTVKPCFKINGIPRRITSLASCLNLIFAPSTFFIIYSRHNFGKLTSAKTSLSCLVLSLLSL